MLIRQQMQASSIATISDKLKDSAFREQDGRFGQACSSCQRNRVLQSAKPKEAVVQQELLEFMSHEADERSLAVLGTIWMGSSEESSL